MQKRTAILLLACFMAAGCGSSVQNTDAAVSTAAGSTPETDTQDNVPADTKVLVMYFDQGLNSVSAGDDEADAVTSASLAGYSSDDLTVNNIRVMKDEIIDRTGADSYAIRITEPYADSYEDMVNQARDDQDSDKQFTFKEPLPDPAAYDVIFIGTPVWWGQLPQPVVNVFEQADFTGKTVIPFGIHLGSRFGQMLTQMAEYEPDATISDNGLTVNSRTANDEVKAQTDDWLSSLGY